MLGTTIGTYRVLHALGQGGMGTVYLAEHALLGRRVALKVLRPACSLDHDIVRRFFNEARAVASISDPGIVQIFDFGIHTDGSAYIVMELLEGEPLDARLRRHGPLTPSGAVRLIRQAADSLAAAHARGIIHRDLKPENLFAVGDPAVTGGERLKLVDFGVAKLTADDPATSRTRTGLLIGTPVYMSPEQCRGTGEVDARSDVYALGCVLFTLLAGRPPFVHDSSGDLIVAHLREPPPSVTDFAPDVPRELDDVVQRCLAKAPADRYPSMQAFGHALDLVAGKTLYPAHASSHLARLPTESEVTRLFASGPSVAASVATSVVASVAASVLAPSRRRRWLLIAATAVTIVSLAVAAWALRSFVSRRAARPGHAAAMPLDSPPAATTPTSAAGAQSNPVDDASVPAPGVDAGADAAATQNSVLVAGTAPASVPIDEASARAGVPGPGVDAGADAGADAAARQNVMRAANTTAAGSDLGRRSIARDHRGRGHVPPTWVPLSATRRVEAGPADGCRF